MRTKPEHVYVPESFDPKTALPPDLQKHADSARYFLHRIIWGNVQKARTLEGYVPLKFDYLKDVIPSRALKPLKTALIDNGVIECDGYYQEGVKSLGFRLTPEYRAARITRIALAGKTATKLATVRRAEAKKLRLPVHRYLRNHLNQLEIDLPLALSLLRDHPHFDMVKIPVEQIALKELSPSVCRFGRFHSALTRCPKKVRRALHVQGERLVGIDIANSQPLFLGLILINFRRYGRKCFAFVSFTNTSSNPYKTIEELISDTVLPFPEQEIFPSSSTSPIPTASITTRKARSKEKESLNDRGFTTQTIAPKQKLVNKGNLKADEREYVQLCESGQLYETLMEAMEVMSRRWIKEQFFGVIYGKNQVQSELKTRFRELFPNVAAVIQELKRKDYRFLPCLMQNLESHFIINMVCGRLMTELPQAPVFTIHDSILTTRRYVDRVEATLREEFTRLGLSPTLHSECYDS